MSRVSLETSRYRTRTRSKKLTARRAAAFFHPQRLDNPGRVLVRNHDQNRQVTEFAVVDHEIGRGRRYEVRAELLED